MKSFFALITTAAAAFAQSAETPTNFEIAGVHSSTRPADGFAFMRGPFIRGGRYEIRYATMVELIATAYNVETDKVLGGPSWLEMEHFDVIAKAPPKVSPEVTRTMLQGLLAERFKAGIHPDTKPMPAFALTAGKHPTMKKSDGSGTGGCKFIPPAPQPDGPRTLPVLQFNCRDVTMAAFADVLRGAPASQQYLSGFPVVDKTQLEGGWDFDLKYSVRGPQSLGELITIPDAIEKQLGLKLEPTKVPLPVYTVEKVEQKPTPDPAGLDKALQIEALPTEFEVANLRLTDPDFKGMRLQIQPGGRVTLQGVPLKFLIQQIWNVTDDMLIGAPKWMDSDRYDLLAKAPAAAQQTDVPGGNNNNARGPQQSVDIDTVLTMVKSLLKERFKLEVHMEERPVQAFTLVATKPKLKKADPTSRTRYAEGPATMDSKDPRNANPALSRLVTVQNMTMPQFAAKLQQIAPGYIHSPVLDGTGLEGSYDFTINFSPMGMLQAVGGGRGGRGGDGPPPAANGEASDPSGILTLPEAMERQIGLKLESSKRPVQVLVIDRIERTPTEN